MIVDLRISGETYEGLRAHLYPGDEKEAVALALCGIQHSQDGTTLLVHKLIPIPYSDCLQRTQDTVRWKTQRLVENLEYAAAKRFAVVKFHSHPTGYPSFSDLDDRSDKELFNSIFSWIDGVDFHGSVVMLPEGKLFGRAIDSNLRFQPFRKIAIVGHDLRFHFGSLEGCVREFELRTAQAFGPATTAMVGQLTVGVVGCSGTGSPVVEQLARLGFKKIVLVDPDKIEVKNLNRILNSKMRDAVKGRFKVDVLKEAIESMGLGTEVEALPFNLFDSRVINSITGCDVLFGCMDTVDGRQLLNTISTFYLIPYFDLGVKLVADGRGGIEQVWATVHYLQPGRSSLMTRGVYTHEDVAAASLFRQDPQQYRSLKSEGYIKNVSVESPAVISVNMQIASLAVIEFLSRIHKFRYEDSSEGAITRISLTDCYIQRQADTEVDTYLQKYCGRGDCQPILNMPELT